MIFFLDFKIPDQKQNNLETTDHTSHLLSLFYYSLSLIFNWQVRKYQKKKNDAFLDLFK